MKKLVFLLVLAILLSGCAQNGTGNANGATAQNNSGAGASQPSGSPPSPGGTATTHTIHIKNFAFDPADLTIKKGDTVIWSNEDSVPHSIKSASGTFDSSVISPGSGIQHTFTDSQGSYGYSCGIHPSMHGTITITD